MSDYIPPELIPNIIARVPVDDVLRCRSVCKSWYELITCPSFTSLHLNLFNQDQEPRLLVKYFKLEDIRKHYYVHSDNQTFDQLAELDPPFSAQFQEIDCINGLFCFFNWESGTITLWNPSLRKSFVLPESRVLSGSRSNYNRTVGFGFIAASNEYKIVSFWCGTVEIYELSIGSWRDLQLEESLDVKVEYEQVHLNGILHWYVCNPRIANNTSNYICFFDLKNEKFGTLMFPSCLCRNVYDLDVCFISSTSRESLRLVEYKRNGSCEIWEMKEYGVADSWQKLFTINTLQHDLRNAYHIRHNEEILFECQISGNRKLVSYDCNNNRVKNLGVLTKCIVNRIHTFVESLALIKGPNEVKIDEEAANICNNI